MAQNKLKISIIACFLISMTGILNAQTVTKYWVRFKDKAGSPYSISNPSAFLSAKSIARRTAHNINIDLTDIPVNQTYINAVNATSAQVFETSKWLNAAIVFITNASQLTAINSLTCVLSSSQVGRHSNPHINKTNETTEPITSAYKSTKHVTSYNYGPAITQVSQIGVDCMHDLGYRGQNMTIAVIDAGFNQADINPVFDSLRNEGRILGTRDYVMGNTSVYEDDSHGAMVLSIMAGNSPGNLIGTGPKAQFWLLRSEDVSSEKLIEECNWVVAAEFADSVGADITTTSLGYTTFDNAADNHVYADLNGHTSVASIAATMAVRKGLFVLNAAGNEGGGSWMYIGVPADADSICTVGSVNGSGVHSNFSSIGPTADGRIKPDLSTMGEGTYVCQPGYNFTAGNGTSFATPVLAGAVACLWQAHPTKTNMEILHAIKATATQSTTPDNNYGWGIPNMCAAHNFLITQSIHEEFEKQNISLYPNPTKNIISFSLNQTPESIMIIDVLGNHIAFTLNTITSNQYSIHFPSEIANGMYCY
jgi:serine protease AprX